MSALSLICQGVAWCVLVGGVPLVLWGIVELVGVALDREGRR